MSEVRLIDANALDDSFRHAIVKCKQWFEVAAARGEEESKARAEQAYVTFMECSMRLKKQPTVDAVPVCRCRDCRFHIKEDDFEYWCNGFCQPARLVNPDDYCSRGMLKECTVETCGYCENGLCYRAEDAPKSRNCPFTKGEANGKG